MRHRSHGSEYFWARRKLQKILSPARHPQKNHVTGSILEPTMELNKNFARIALKDIEVLCCVLEPTMELK